MNGEEQKARKGEIARLDRDLNNLEKEMLDAWRVEVDARMKSYEELKSLVAEMIDTETQFRKRAVQQAKDEIDVLAKRLTADEISGTNFIFLRFWRRVAWVLFGAKSLGWFRQPRPLPVAAPPAQVSLADGKAGYRGEKPH